MNGERYRVGYGDPGLSIHGESNNCLIDSIRQSLGITCDRRRVRQDLMNEFGRAAPDAVVAFG